MESGNVVVLLRLCVEHSSIHDDPFHGTTDEFNSASCFVLSVSRAGPRLVCAT
jgi:hypothetical protein